MGSSPVAVGETIAGKYRIERVIGMGGMGIVVAARHLVLEKTVAIKFLLPDCAKDSAVVERFTREARALGKIQSDHVAHVMDVERLEDGTSFMVMEYLEGQDLATAVHQRGPIPTAEAVGWLLEACEAISEAHAAGIVHRDLKPANLFLAKRPNGRLIVKVLDFGISKSLGGGGDDTEPLALTSTAAMLGSPLYMAPEQLHGSRDVDRRTDIWACGVILFELLAGARPFEAESIGALVSSILHDVPPPIHTIRADVPEALSRIVGRCLEKERADRFQTIDELSAELAPFGPADLGSRRPPAAAAVSALASTSAAPPGMSPSAPQERTGRDAWAGTKPKLEIGATRRAKAAAVAGAACVIGLLLWLALSGRTTAATSGAAATSAAPAESTATPPSSVTAVAPHPPEPTEPPAMSSSARTTLAPQPSAQNPPKTQKAPRATASSPLEPPPARSPASRDLPSPDPSEPSLPKTPLK